MTPPQMPSRATSSPPKIPWVRRIRIIPTTAITSLSGKPRRLPCRRRPCRKTREHGYPPGGKYSARHEAAPSRLRRADKCRPAASGLLLCFDVAADLLHVETADGLDQ